MKLRSQVLALSILGTLVVTNLATASAEGAIHSSLYNVSSGFQSRSWYDFGYDYETTGVHSAGCSSQYGEGSHRFNLTLYREISFWPDTNLGTRDATYCYYGDANSIWQNPGSGNYHVTVETWDWQRVSASTFNIWY